MSEPFLRAVQLQGPEIADLELDKAFFALSDPVRRAILVRLEQGSATVGELAAPFPISLQAVSRHIHMLAAAGLVSQERTGRVSRCSLATGPILAATVWLSRYSRYWEGQFDGLVKALAGAAPSAATTSTPLKKTPRRTGRRK